MRGDQLVGVDGDWLRAEVLAAARAAFAELPPGEYCGYALYSDDGAMTVCCAVNTVEHLARAQAADPGDPEYWRWCTAEWAMEGIGDEHFEEICRWLRAAGAQLGGGAAFVEFRDMVHETCVEALEDLVAGRELDTAGAAVVVFAVSDTDDPERDAAWIRRLNAAAWADQFARWIGAAPDGIS
jgi:hypothetical protein